MSVAVRLRVVEHVLRDAERKVVRGRIAVAAGQLAAAKNEAASGSSLTRIVRCYRRLPTDHRANPSIDGALAYSRTLAASPGNAGITRKGASDIAEIEIGAVIDGTVERITPYGAFLKLEDGRLGLVHISEIDRNYVKDVHEHLREGDVVQAKVRAIKEDGKIDLSIKALQDPAPPRPRRGSDPEFEQMLKKFMRQSEERLVDYKRAVEHKRK